MPRRRGDEHCQVMAVVNFKGGSGKTTTAAHLAQYLALQDIAFCRRSGPASLLPLGTVISRI